MAGEPYLSEIRLMSFNFPPKGWALCNGQILPIAQNQALFSLMGTTYGGNGSTTFALPDLRGRVPIHFGGAHDLGERSGAEAHTLSIAELPTHTHVLSATTAAGDSFLPHDTGGPTPHQLAKSNLPAYHAPTNLVPMVAGTLSSVGGSQAHTNLMPYLTISFCIALQGIFPARN